MRAPRTQNAARGILLLPLIVLFFTPSIRFLIFLVVVKDVTVNFQKPLRGKTEKSEKLE